MNKKNPDWAHLDEVPEEELSEVQKVIAAVERNPLQFIIGAVVVAGCILGTLVYQQQTDLGNAEAGSVYARALNVEEESERLDALSVVAEEGGTWSVEALYMAGETAIRLGEYEKAKGMFERVRSEHGDHALAAQAVEGLAFIAENGGDLEGALALYGEVETRWPDSFSAQLQQEHIGRVKEAQGDAAGAKEAYEQQAALMENSRASFRAQVALNRLEQAHPDLFPKEEEVVVEAAEEDLAIEVVESEDAAAE